MLQWSIIVSFLTFLGAFCVLADWLVMRDEQSNAQECLVNWWIRLGEFKYVDAIKEANRAFIIGFDSVFSKKAQIL